MLIMSLSMTTIASYFDPNQNHRHKRQVHPSEPTHSAPWQLSDPHKGPMSCRIAAAGPQPLSCRRRHHLAARAGAAALLSRSAAAPRRGSGAGVGGGGGGGGGIGGRGIGGGGGGALQQRIDVGERAGRRREGPQIMALRCDSSADDAGSGIAAVVLAGYGGAVIGRGSGGRSGGGRRGGGGGGSGGVDAGSPLRCGRLASGALQPYCPRRPPAAEAETRGDQHIPPCRRVLPRHQADRRAERQQQAALFYVFRIAGCPVESIQILWLVTKSVLQVLSLGCNIGALARSLVAASTAHQRLCQCYSKSYVDT